MSTDVCFVYMTAGSADEARRIGEALVEERLAACVNVIDGMQSIYRWQGETQHDKETVLIAKTGRHRVAALTERVRALHSYDCPCVLAMPVEDGNPAFIGWIGDEVK